MLLDASAEHGIVDVDLADAGFASLFLVLLLECIPPLVVLVLGMLLTLGSLLLFLSKEFLQQVLCLLLFKIREFA